jgi:tRNA nucleotidyltransferase/poly(A) polymerase
MLLKNYLKKIPYLSLISSLAKKRKINVWLVGGVLRDVFLKKENIIPKDKENLDFDFCVDKNILSLIKEFSKKISSKYIVLDEKQASYRVILKREAKIFTYDFTLMRGENFKEDLSLRDFSINTLAVDLKDKDSRLIDFFKAREDIKKRIVRVIKEQVFLDDPLRILRGFAFVSLYNFGIENNTKKSMIKYKKFLKKVSKERINEEIFKIFSSPFSFKVVKEMDRLGILKEIIPQLEKTKGVWQGPYHHLDVWEHSLETLRSFEYLYKRKLSKNRDVFNYLQEEIIKGRKRLLILKLACLIHDVGKPLAKKIKDKKTIFHTHEKIGTQIAEEIALNLRLSSKEKDILKKLVFWHLRPGYLADQAQPSTRAIYRFFRDTQEEGVGVILLSLSDWRATKGPLVDEKRRRRHERVMFNLIDYYFEEKKKKPLPKIVNGYDIMRRFKISPSPLIGEILKKIKEEQALGRVSSKKDAYRVAKKIITEYQSKKLNYKK